MTQITKEILLDAGFICSVPESSVLAKFQKDEYGIENYQMFSKWTDDDTPIKIDIDNGYNNRGTEWHLHIDNNLCETIGCADIDTIEQFNKLMEVFESSFRL